jgi:general secretion pathway protein H
MKAVGGAHRKGGRGFSLVEILVVLAVISVIASLSLPSVSALSRRHGAESAAREMLLTMRRARWQALSSGWPARIVISPRTVESPTRYVVEGDGAGGWLPAGETRSLAASVGLAFTGPSTKYFYPDGTCSMGSIILTGDGGARWRLSLNPATGRARLYCDERGTGRER